MNNLLIEVRCPVAARIPQPGSLRRFASFAAADASKNIGIGSQPLIDAHELAESLDFAGCVLTPSAARAFTTAATEAENSAFIDVVGRLHTVPIKTGAEEELFVMHPMVRRNEATDDIGTVVHKHVHTAFTAHNKGIIPTAIRKFRNTVRVFTELYPHSALVPRAQ